MAAFDFSAILLALTVLFGVVWLFDRLFLVKARRARTEASGTEQPEPWPVDWARSLFPVILVVLLLRSFVAEPFRIPSGSMMPTLDVGDFILVNKFAYGLRMPAFNNKLVENGSPVVATWSCSASLAMSARTKAARRSVAATSRARIPMRRCPARTGSSG